MSRMAHKLESHVSAKIARTNPLEGGPSLVAQFAGTNVMADTWGGYASRLLEFHEGKYTPEQVLELLAINPSDLKDPSILFQHTSDYSVYDFGDYKADRKRGFQREGEEYYAPEQKRLLLILDAIEESFRVENGQPVAEQIEDELDEYLEGLRSGKQKDREEWYETSLVMKSVAYREGVVIPGPEFIEIMLGVNLLDDESGTQSELAHDWIWGVSCAIDNMLSDYKYDAGEIRLKDITFGKEAIDDVRSAIESLYNAVTRKYVPAMWREINPAFYTIALEDNPLISGKHGEQD